MEEFVEDNTNFEDPFCTDPAKEPISLAFPQFMSFDREERDEDIVEYGPDIKQQIELNEEDERAISFIKNNILTQIYQNPFLDIQEYFEQVYKDNFSDKPEFPPILKFHSSEKVPDIQYLSKNYQQRNFDQINNPPWKIIQMQKIDCNKFNDLLCSIYNSQKGKIPNLERIFCWYPDYLYTYDNTLNTLFFQEGPLTMEYRIYIAIISSLSFDCEYIYLRLCQYYLDMGGDKLWIENGNENIPPKLQTISKLVTIMAYEPYTLLEKDTHGNYFQDLMSCDNPWSKAEIIFAVSIISFVQMQCGFVNCFGIKDELNVNRKSSNQQETNLNSKKSMKQTNSESTQQRIEDDFVNCIKKHSSDKQTQSFLDANKLYSQSPQKKENTTNLEKIEEKTKNQENDQTTQQEEEEQKQNQENQENQQNQENLQNVNQKQRNDSEMSDSMLNSSLKEGNSQISKEDSQDKRINLVLQEDSEYINTILKKHYKFLDQNIQPLEKYNRVCFLKGNEFNFKYHGSALIKEYNDKLSQVLLDQIETVKSMTNNNFGEKKLQTYPFRKAIRLYVENLYCFKHDDVNYKDNMNDLLQNRELKNLLRVIVKRPRNMQQKDFNVSPLKTLDITEVGHIILLAIHTKMELSLSYCLAALKNT